MAGKHPKRKERPGVDRLGRTELHYTANEGDVVKATQLIAAGAKVDLADDNGWTPLHFAAQAQCVPIAESLLATGARVDSQDRDGNTPLWRAVFDSRGKGALIDLLRQHGADPMRKNLHGVSPLDLARTIGNYDVAQFFRDLPE
jgi:ankyrin repeat protein